VGQKNGDGEGGVWGPEGEYLQPGAGRVGRKARVGDGEIVDGRSEGVEERKE